MLKKLIKFGCSMQKPYILHRTMLKLSEKGILHQNIFFSTFSFFVFSKIGSEKNGFFGRYCLHKSCFPCPNILYISIISKFGNLSRTSKRPHGNISYMLLVISSCIK